MKIEEETTKRLIAEGVCISKTQAKKVQACSEDMGVLERYIFRKKMEHGGEIIPVLPEDKDYDIMHL
jgi:hypothetical protein